MYTVYIDKINLCTQYTIFSLVCLLCILTHLAGLNTTSVDNEVISFREAALDFDRPYFLLVPLRLLLAPPGTV